jgi:hypothetical protein
MVIRFTRAYVGVRKEYWWRRYRWQQPKSDLPLLSLERYSQKKSGSYFNVSITKSVLSVRPLMNFTLFYIGVPGIYINKYILNCFFENTYQFLLTLPKVANVVMESHYSYMKGFPKDAGVNNFPRIFL